MQLAKRFSASPAPEPGHSVQTDSPGKPPQPNAEATAVFLFGLVLTAAYLHGETPSALARVGAIGVGLSLAASFLLEAVRSRANLLRTDVIMLVAFYGLTFVEFLFPQPDLDRMVQRPEDIYLGVQACLLAFAGLAVGRHLVGSAQQRSWDLTRRPFPPGALLLLFWISFALAYLHMLVAVDFDPVELVRNFMVPRFYQAWQRGKYGDWKVLLGEIGALIYLVPPIAGVVLGRGKVYTSGNRFLVLLALLFTMFYGFSSGTRNIPAVFAITFVLAYFFGQGGTLTVGVRAVAILAVLLIGGSAYYGVQFRRVGLSNYLDGAREQRSDVTPSLFVDYSIYSISGLIQVFPTEHDYIGMAVPIWMAVRPIPRALWPGKPDGVDLAPETYLGVRGGTTIATTFVGESFMAAGFLGIAMTAISLGALARWWTARTYSLHSDFGVLIYSSGFFATVITMRSLYLLPVAILPTIAAIVFGLGFVGYSNRQTVSRN